MFEGRLSDRQNTLAPRLGLDRVCALTTASSVSDAPQQLVTNLVLLVHDRARSVISGQSCKAFGRYVVGAPVGRNKQRETYDGGDDDCGAAPSRPGRTWRERAAKAAAQEG
jgi:hypothetical protein